MTSQDVKL